MEIREIANFARRVPRLRPKGRAVGLILYTGHNARRSVWIDLA